MFATKDGLRFLWALIVKYLLLRHSQELEAQERQFVQETEEFYTGRTCSAILMGLFLVWLAIGVSSTELTIRWNKIQGVNNITAVGQLIPFIMGLGLFTNIVYLLVKKYGPIRFEGGSDAQDEEASGEQTDSGKHSLIIDTLKHIDDLE